MFYIQCALCKQFGNMNFEVNLRGFLNVLVSLLCLVYCSVRYFVSSFFCVINTKSKGTPNWRISHNVLCVWSGCGWQVILGSLQTVRKCLCSVRDVFWNLFGKMLLTCPQILMI